MTEPRTDAPEATPPPADGSLPRAADRWERAPRAWSESERFVPSRVVRPLQRVLQAEAAGGILMLLAAVAALVWANSPWSESYHDLFATVLSVELGGLVHLDMALETWINDALMAIFFFVVGLEIKRELVVGELRDPRAAALPAIAAVGGMAVPAAIFLLFNAGGAGSNGWGIPMATDIAFAVGVVSLVGDRVPGAAKLFLLALAIVDDIGAILVIALFYTEQLSLGWLAVAGGTLVAMYVIQRLEVRSLLPYIALALFGWLATHESGVHATIMGVALGLMTPVRPFYHPRRFAPSARRLIDEIAHDYEAGWAGASHEHGDVRLFDLTRLAAETQAPLDRLEHRLLPWSSYVIVPVFALANAGVELGGDTLGGALSDPVVLGVGLGLIVGKTVGVFAAAWLAVASGIGRLPAHTHWRDIAGLSALAGIGFTVALFVTSLAFAQPALTDSAKVGILGGSLIAGLIGYCFLKAAPPVPEEARSSSDGAAPGVAPRPLP